jgi:hypothetical protein
LDKTALAVRLRYWLARECGKQPFPLLGKKPGKRNP